MFNISIAQISLWTWSNALYNSRGNQINIAQITILQLLSTNQMLVFEERGKLEYLGKNLSWQSRGPTNSIHMTLSVEIKPGPHWWKASALTTRPTLPPQTWSDMYRMVPYMTHETTNVLQPSISSNGSHCQGVFQCQYQTLGQSMEAVHWSMWRQDLGHIVNRNNADPLVYFYERSKYWHSTVWVLAHFHCGSLAKSKERKKASKKPGKKHHSSKRQGSKPPWSCSN